MKINCIAVDDEPLALSKMKKYIQQIEFLNLLATFNNGIDSINFLKSNPVDLMFLDIQMEDLTGIELLEALQKKPKVIITTAYDSYALKGYELDVTDYLLKPISFQRFVKAVDKVYESMTMQPAYAPSPIKQSGYLAGNDFLFVRTEYKIQKIQLKEILYIEGMKDYIRIVTRGDKIMTLQSLKKFLSLLPGSNFIRVHKSFIIAIDKIDSIKRNRITIGEAIIPIGETYKQLFYNSLEGKYLI